MKLFVILAVFAAFGDNVVSRSLEEIALCVGYVNVTEVCLCLSQVFSRRRMKYKPKPSKCKSKWKFSVFFPSRRCELRSQCSCVVQQQGAGLEAATQDMFPDQSAADSAWTGRKLRTIWKSVTTTTAGSPPLTKQDKVGLNSTCLLMYQTNPRNPDQSRRPWCYVRRIRQIRREPCAVTICKPDCKGKWSVFYVELLSDLCFCPNTGPETPVPSPPAAMDTGSSELFWALLFLSFSLVLSELIPGVFAELSCGERSEQRTNKIVNGSFTDVESHPWVAAIFSHGGFLCGGSLISPCWVVTAAHCFLDGWDIQNQLVQNLQFFRRSELFCLWYLLSENTDILQLSVHLGKKAITETNAEKEQIFSVEKLIIHEQFDSTSFNNDIGVYIMCPREDKEQLGHPCTASRSVFSFEFQPCWGSEGQTGAVRWSQHLHE